MSKNPQKRSPEIKVKIALEAIKNEKTVAQLATEYHTHPKQIQRWRDQLLDEAKNIFIHKTTQKKADPDREQLLHLINQLNSELDFLKKKLQKNV